jgi:hypothetical protein
VDSAAFAAGDTTTKFVDSLDFSPLAGELPGYLTWRVELYSGHTLMVSGFCQESEIPD